ncbi:EAL domain-containing protein [Salmonella enterica subsp. enterica]|nr:EAL domain-containing protein [Salmonella enterica]EBQ9480102.1 hypothetical protein [Salmonella enterica subsp. enterica serovar Kokomlemle]ECS5198548.1 EAL domain-containing protein [Salmonella enterica subsp. enterica serovar Poano]EBJ7122040.1 EAL domain-containing protein [Salmonella enterica]ECX4750939.1 EAL domain-containing protein [Salmonella enterica]
MFPYHQWIPARETLLQALGNGEFRTVYQPVVGSDIHTIAEGVETEEQAKYLSARGVDSQQGYYWYHPMDMQTLVSTLSKVP